MNAGSANWNWPDAEAVLAAFPAGESEPILCGGQAVAFWAFCFDLGALVSRDLDLVGDREDAERVAAAIGATVHYPHRYDMTVLTAVVRGTWRGRPLTIEWLSSVPGIETDPESISERMDLGRGRLRVLHPVALAMAKLHALRFFDQQGRNDALHLQVALSAARQWLEAEVAVNAPRVLRLIHQWHRAARVAGNRRELVERSLDWRSLVPLERLQQAAADDGLVARFISEHWVRIAAD